MISISVAHLYRISLVPNLMRLPRLTLSASSEQNMTRCSMSLFTSARCELWLEMPHKSRGKIWKNEIKYGKIWKKHVENPQSPAANGYQMKFNEIEHSFQVWFDKPAHTWVICMFYLTNIGNSTTPSANQNPIDVCDLGSPTLPTHTLRQKTSKTQTWQLKTRDLQLDVTPEIVINVDTWYFYFVFTSSYAMLHFMFSCQWGKNITYYYYYYHYHYYCYCYYYHYCCYYCYYCHYYYYSYILLLLLLLSWLFLYMCFLLLLWLLLSYYYYYCCYYY